ncbi:MAG TPA: hypothetical protein VLF95_09760, partial [Vicinamibacteria bacterium]|nr:hypothetical protein [Vicinamibacteria bacterium]
MSPSAGRRETHGAPDRAGARAPRRSRLRRAFRVGSLLVLGLGLAAILLVAFAFTFLHTPSGRTATRVFVELWVSGATGGTLRLGRLDLALWKGEAAATNLRLRLDGTTVDVPRVEVAWRPKAGPRVRLVRPVVVVRDTGRPKAIAPVTGLAAQPWRALERLAAVEVVEGR